MAQKQIPVYRVWANMLGRHRPEVCKRWHKFENFLADMGYPPAGMFLCRHDAAKSYGPENCFWSAERQQYVTHGQTRGGQTKLYQVWNSMLGRCLNRNSAKWPYYGGRGIGVCDRWLDFANFLADMGQQPAGMSLERKDNNRGYDPDNCVWATRQQQQRNMRNNRWITICGERMVVTDACARFGISQKRVFARNSDARKRRPETILESFLHVLDRHLDTYRDPRG